MNVEKSYRRPAGIQCYFCTMRLGCCVDKIEIIKAFVESLMHFQLKKITYYNGHFGEIIIEIYVLHCPALLRWE